MTGQSNITLPFFEDSSSSQEPPAAPTLLQSQTAGVGTNRGFRMRNGEMYTYQQTKTGLTYLYPKRKVGDDGISTTHTDL